MADIRMAGASLLTTVTEVANTATSLVTSVGTGAKMLNAFADNAHWQQSKRIAVSKVGYEDNLVTTKALEIAKSRATLHDYISANPTQSTEINDIITELKKALA
jgi:hypothetical protein